jgi:VWFA-related protein
LRAEDFTLREDGGPQTLAAFEAVDRPPAAAAPADAQPSPPSRVSSNRGLSARASRAFVIVFDDLHLDVAEAQRAREAVAGFLEGAFDGGDRVSLVTTSGDAWLHTRMPEGGDALRSILPRLRGRARTADSMTEGMTDHEALQIAREGNPLITGYVTRRWKAAATDLLSFREGDTVGERVIATAARIGLEVERRNQETLDVLARAFASLGTVRGRKSVLLVSGGLVLDPRLAESRRALAESRRANAALYFVDARGLAALGPAFTAEAAAPTDLQDTSLALGALRVAAEGSESLAADTGGFSIRNRNDLAAGARTILLESSSYYLLGYAPPERRRNGHFRRIDVGVAREGVRVRARRGYYPAAAGRAPREGRDEALQRALDSPFDLDAIPLRAAALVFGEKAPGKEQVLITADVDIRALAFRDAGGVFEGSLEYRLVVADRETGTLHRGDEQIALKLPPARRERYSRSGFPVTREVVLAPGRYQARVVARDATSGRVGSLSHDFEVPKAEGLRLSTPVLSDRLREPPGVGPELIARRTFSPSGDLHCRFEVYGAARSATTGLPAVRAAFAVQFADGRLLAASRATPMTPGPDGTLSRTLGFPLGNAPPGRYELILVVEDEVAGGRVEAREAFSVGGPDAFERE